MALTTLLNSLTIHLLRFDRRHALHHLNSTKALFTNENCRRTCRRNPGMELLTLPSLLGPSNSIHVYPHHKPSKMQQLSLESSFSCSSDPCIFACNSSLALNLPTLSLRQLVARPTLANNGTLHLPIMTMLSLIHISEPTRLRRIS